METAKLGAITGRITEETSNNKLLIAMMRELSNTISETDKWIQEINGHIRNLKLQEPNNNIESEAMLKDSVMAKVDPIDFCDDLSRHISMARNNNRRLMEINKALDQLI